MARHPKERPPGWGASSRRDFLRQSGGAALGLGGASALLAACSNNTDAAGGGSSSGAEPTGPGGLPLARPNKRVTLPIYSDNKPIASGLQPETGGTFNIFNYPNYLDPGLLKQFGKKYNVQVQVTTFDDIAQGIARMASGAVTPDITEMTPDNLDQVVAGKLIQPINLDYIPNLKKNVWPELISPFYDVGSNYGVPYTVYKTGLAWRIDQVKEDIAGMPQPWDILWESQKYAGKVAVLSEDRETIAMALLRKGHLDINTEDPKLINAAVADLKQLYSICNVKVGDVQYQTIPEDKAWLNQAWSGDMLGAVFYYLPNKQTGPLLRFWAAPKGKVPIQNDMWSIVKGTKKPVLAHLFMNFMLDNGNAYQNFITYTGYQPPINEITPTELVSKGLIPETLANCVMEPHELGPTSIQEMTLTIQGQQLWQNGYSDFLAG